ncbi:unnamed protein product [marine sediment metagenome]|uniref:Arrestin-like N-terminal domain-containing protein n=1 Tax=marine sediment metagenome TaxID=412755 RepID=X1R1D6_9ZZZZ
MTTLQINSIESLLQGIGVEALAGEKLTVMVGDTVRVHLDVEYRGPALDGSIHISWGHQDTWFNEDGNKQDDFPVHFNQSMDWVPYKFACDVLIGGSYGPGYDLYAKIEGVPGPDIFAPTLLNVLDVLGAAEFRNFKITSYDKL